MELRKLTDTYHQRMLVHVDIFTPFADLIAPTKADLMSGLSVNKFASYPNSTYLSRANKITIFTLRTPRRTILQRLLEKCASKKSELVRTLLAQIYSDVYGEAPYQRLCQAWDDFTSILPNATRWNVIEKDTGYLVLPQDGQES
ncbi:MAG: hypothetical protein GY943_26565 [Chloroflexi bacterium]|nr:hypothetical protein [Chloroflexota bacterium]